MAKPIHPFDVGVVLGTTAGSILGFFAPTAEHAVAGAAGALIVYLVLDRVRTRIQYGNWLYQPPYDGFPPADEEDLA